MCLSKQQVPKDQAGLTPVPKRCHKAKQKPAVTCTVFRGWQEVPTHIPGDCILLDFMERTQGHAPLESSLQGSVLGKQTVLRPGQQSGAEVYHPDTLLHSWLRS